MKKVLVEIEFRSRVDGCKNKIVNLMLLANDDEGLNLKSLVDDLCYVAHLDNIKIENYEKSAISGN